MVAAEMVGVGFRFHPGVIEVQRFISDIDLGRAGSYLGIDQMHMAGGNRLALLAKQHDLVGVQLAPALRRQCIAPHGVGFGIVDGLAAGNVDQLRAFAPAVRPESETC